MNATLARTSVNLAQRLPWSQYACCERRSDWRGGSAQTRPATTLVDAGNQGRPAAWRPRHRRKFWMGGSGEGGFYFSVDRQQGQWPITLSVPPPIQDTRPAWLTVRGGVTVKRHRQDPVSVARVGTGRAPLAGQGSALWLAGVGISRSGPRRPTCVLSRSPRADGRKWDGCPPQVVRPTVTGHGRQKLTIGLAPPTSMAVWWQIHCRVTGKWNCTKRHNRWDFAPPGRRWWTARPTAPRLARPREPEDYIDSMGAEVRCDPSSAASYNMFVR